ncbi:MAG: ATP-binding cassette domain-containing protein [Thermoleophilia bacterium]|nr:ATP-binding cassette domain-containing protein [Thermoleophilia bacterium]
MTAFADAFHELRIGWRRRTTYAFAAFAIAALAPLAFGEARTADLAGGLYLACAAVGLAFAVGVAGLPSLAQGAFVAVGAVVAAHLLAAGIPLPLAAVAGGLGGSSAGGLVGYAFARLPRAGFAAATWIVSWLVAFMLQSITWFLGGSEGVVVGGGPTASGHYELALALTGLAALGYLALARSPIGLRLAAARDREAAAAALGVPVLRLRVVAVAASGAVAGVAGAFAVQLAGVGDATQYGPFLSFRLFVVVLVGGALAPLGAPAGILVLGVLSVAADFVGRLENVAAARAHTLLTAIMLLGIVSLGWEGIVRAPKRRRRAGPGSGPDRARPATLEARALGKAFGNVVAAQDVAVGIAPGRITALVGPNGSGKTTVLRMLAGTIEPDEGSVVVAHGSVARTLQATAVFPTLTPLEHVLVASAGRRSRAGLVRSLFSTPQARAEDAAYVAHARAVLDRFGVLHDVPAGELPVTDQRALMIAAAYATGASVLLVDEPTAGASTVEAARMTGLLRSLRDEGLALLVVEHNLGVVRRLADRVVVLDAGRVIADGTPDAVAADDAVRAAYLGRRSF